ncbi:MAG: hypothetical protein K8L91_27615, partial [Anaerolineae bacterium]|nr:hypothetical protein [Anaerolineae bacterium]
LGMLNPFIGWCGGRGTSKLQEWAWLLTAHNQVFDFIVGATVQGAVYGAIGGVIAAIDPYIGLLMLTMGVAEAIHWLFSTYTEPGDQICATVAGAGGAIVGIATSWTFTTGWDNWSNGRGRPGLGSEGPDGRPNNTGGGPELGGGPNDGSGGPYDPPSGGTPGDEGNPEWPTGGGLDDSDQHPTNGGLDDTDQQPTGGGDGIPPIGGSVIERPGYSGPSEGWTNQKPSDLSGGKQGVSLSEMFASKDYEAVRPVFGDPNMKEASKYNFAIDSDGTIRVGRSPEFNHHPDLVNGRNVFGAGEMYLDKDGNFLIINNRSGHYRPTASEFFPYLKHLMQSQIGGRSIPNDNVFDGSY